MTTKTTGAKVLVADDDLWILRMIATVIERRGHSVTLASDGEEALTHALISRPDLVVTDIQMPRMDGWDLIATMREHDSLKDVPVIVLSDLSDDDSRVRGYQLGVEDYIAKPFRFEELDIRVNKLLHRGHQTKPSHPNRPGAAEVGHQTIGLVGTLDQVGLPSLLTLLELDRKTGILTLHRESSGRAESGQIELVQGRCHAARITNNDTSVDAEAVYLLLEWNGGQFEFNQQPIATEDRIGRSTTGLLMEAAQRADEAGHADSVSSDSND